MASAAKSAAMRRSSEDEAAGRLVAALRGALTGWAEADKLSRD